MDVIIEKWGVGAVSYFLICFGSLNVVFFFGGGIAEEISLEGFCAQTVGSSAKRCLWEGDLIRILWGRGAVEVWQHLFEGT